ncbi:MAG: glycerol-3-phosphate ABC transporter substrate-binding protein, partial [Methyloversatilis sp.]|nr:glycerol-3-phosphate ABC transporter substrate-binding protein [Methyloversatilis sp.]
MLKKSFAALLAASVVSWPLAAAAAAEVKKPAAKATKSATKPAAKSTTKSAAKPVAPQEQAEIELAHGLDEAGASALQALVDEFNASGKGKQKIVLAPLVGDGAKLPAMQVLDDEARQHFLEGKPR